MPCVRCVCIIDSIAKPLSNTFFHILRCLPLSCSLCSTTAIALIFMSSHSSSLSLHPAFVHECSSTLSTTSFVIIRFRSTYLDPFTDPLFVSTQTSLLLFLVSQILPHHVFWHFAISQARLCSLSSSVSSQPICPHHFHLLFSNICLYPSFCSSFLLTA